MAEPLMMKIAMIGVLGVTAQWVAWRTGRPAIVFLLAAGIIVGPIVGILDPQVDFGELRDPIIKLAVAVILFEGGLQLNLRDLREAGNSVRRLILLGVPIGWMACSAAVHFGAGLSWEISMLFGGILVVTGPTVIGPMLRAINVPRRVGDTLKWEAIINDPIGALLAIVIFAEMTFGSGEEGHGSLLSVAIASLGAGALGFALGWLLTWAFPRGYVPEYLKAPVLLVTVIAGFVVADFVQHESGLVTVTVMGMVMGNRQTFATNTLRRFKEDLAVLLIAGVFIILSAQLTWENLTLLPVRSLLFLVLLMFVARPLTVLVSLMWSDMPWKERLFIAWIAPRGIVAVAITGLFALRLTERGVPGAELLVPLAFITAIATITAHGFTAKWWARYLGIDRGQGNGLMLIGINDWSVALAEAMQKAGVPVAVADSSKFKLRAARKKELDAHMGDMLDDNFRHHFDWGSFSKVAALSDSDAYNALVCSELGPELGFDKVLQVAPDQRGGMTTPRAGMMFKEPLTIYDLQTRIAEGWYLSRTKITDQFTFDQFKSQLEEGAMPVAVVRPDGNYTFFSSINTPSVGDGDTIVGFYPPETAEDHKAKREAKTQNANGPQPSSA
ncbi:sodium/hydrogen exchanger [Novosphingobium marinum]|uniref:NhaP-type Na+/H+ or K+/H+ antiporter n=1 Tax=Novosphingobium marinum TaxID=1514948 RepID=A0A7Z0BTZ5_9SPHN|nr:sodium:proton antiporter [Novosphingobium marinum]NYH96546.1 NhaP-type Na+/H+ or K+/H+ antiporter [Novosphingobium marinum]GGC36082.1 sodium/hydrogen exchanger [Novosphingobium marinum]